MRILSKIIKYTFLCLLGLLLLALSALLIFEQPIPDPLLRRITQSLSNTNYLVRANSASFRFSRGLKINNLRVLNRRKPASQPVISASCVDLALNLRRIPWSRSTLVKSITVTDFRYPRLPDSYYIPDSIEFPGRPDFQEQDEPLQIDLPALQPFKLTLIRPEVLGVTPRKVVADSVSVTPEGIRIDGIRLDWPDADAHMSLDGMFELNLVTQRAEGEVHGLARQHHIRPLLVALDITNSYAFIDSFTRVAKPVDAACAFDVNLRNNDLHIHLDLAPEGGCYNRVPLENARGPVDIRVFVRDTYQNARITVGPLVANLADGSRMSGTIVYENTNDVGYVDFLDVNSNTSLSNALAVADVMNDGTLDCIVPATPPAIRLHGRLAVDPAHADANNLSGYIRFTRGSIFTVPLRNASAHFALQGTEVSFSDAHATAELGGDVSGSALISIPDFQQDRASFRVDVSGRDIVRANLSDIFKLKRDDKHGLVKGRISLSGPLSTNLTSKLNGEGLVSCTDERLEQMPLFYGATEFFVKHVPGVKSLVNLSDASLGFTITNGTLYATNAVVSSDVLTIAATGTYDIPKDDLAFSGNITLKENKNFLMQLATSPIRWTGGKIFGFRLKGKIDDPSWSYEQNLLPSSTEIISRSKDIISLPKNIISPQKK